MSKITGHKGVVMAKGPVRVVVSASSQAGGPKRELRRGGGALVTFTALAGPMQVNIPVASFPPHELV